LPVEQTKRLPAAVFIGSEDSTTESSSLMTTLGAAHIDGLDFFNSRFLFAAFF
jgi:hypothetical protein